MSDSAAIDGAASLVASLRALLPLVEEARARPTEPLNRAGAFETVEIDLAGAGPDARYVTTRGGPLQMAGFGLVYLKRGSHPGGLFELTVGGTLQSFGPGDVFKGPFTDVILKRAAGSAQAGAARLLVLKHQLATYDECVEAEAKSPVALVGTFSPEGRPTVYAAITEDTDPTGTGLASAFDISGWRVLEIFIDGLTAAGNATSFELVPFVDPGYAGDWHEQGTGRVPVPDSDTSGFRFRHLVVNVDGRGLMAYSVRALLAVARTGLGIAVRGVR